MELVVFQAIEDITEQRYRDEMVHAVPLNRLAENCGRDYTARLLNTLTGHRPQKLDPSLVAADYLVETVEVKPPRNPRILSWLFSNSGIVRLETKSLDGSVTGKVDFFMPSTNMLTKRQTYFGNAPFPTPTWHDFQTGYLKQRDDSFEGISVGRPETPERQPIAV